ncbi:DUF625-domain-containing protein [Backusella circina FSU 941]|nr:DUF625-domain-containing protein [Backusella circina FSU 941]
MTEETQGNVEVATSHRVKLYQLNVETNWEDKGTGQCVYQVNTDGTPDQLVVHSEEDNSILLTSNVFKRRLYQRQQDTLIVWTESDQRDLALSFQDPAGCEEIWQCIGKRQERDTTRADTSNNLEDDDDLSPKSLSPELESLPLPELSNLKEISETLSNQLTLQEKERLYSFMTSANYVEKLVQLFETCEDLEDIKDLHLLYNVTVSLLVSFGDQGIIDLVLQDDNVMQVMGILEYSPSVPGLKAKHREFLQSRGSAEQYIPVKDDVMIQKIDRAFRLEYLQSIFLTNDNFSDDMFIGSMNTMVYQSYSDIVNYVQNHRQFMNDLFDLVRSEDTSAENRKDAIKFIIQLCNLTKQMQSSARVNLLRALVIHGLFDMLCYGLVEQDQSLRSGCVSLLASFTDLDVNTVRSHLTTCLDDNDLLHVIVSQFTTDADYDFKVQYAEVLRLLLDPNGNIPATGGPSLTVDSKQDSETESFLALFYEKHADTLLRPIDDVPVKPMGLTGSIEALDMSLDQAQLCLYICDLVSFIVRQHQFRSKFILLQKDRFLKIAQFYRCKQICIKLAALRVFRVCIGTSDEFYHQHLIKLNIFEPTIRVLLDTNGRDCLLNSACLDILEFIKRENIKMLVSHLITQFGTVLDTITYIPTTRSLRLKYDQNSDYAASMNKKTSSSPKPTEATIESSETKTDEGMEDDYFNTSDDEEIPEQSSTQQTVVPLVTYDDDEDDDDDTDSNNKKSNNNNNNEDDSLKRKEPDDDTSFLPPKKSDDEDDEDDVLASRTKRKTITTNTTTKMVIKSPVTKKMRSS